MKNTIINRIVKLGLAFAMIIALMSCNNTAGNTTGNTVQKDPETLKKEKAVEDGPFGIRDYKFKNLKDAIEVATKDDLIVLLEDASIPAESYDLRNKEITYFYLNNKTLTVTKNETNDLSFYNGVLLILGSLEDESLSSTIKLDNGVGEIGFNFGTFVLVNIDLKSSAYGIRTNQAMFLPINLRAETRRDCVIAKDSSHCFLGRNTKLISETGKSISYITDYINKDKLELYRLSPDSISIEDCYDYSTYNSSENFLPVEDLGVFISDGIFSNITFGKYITKILGDSGTRSAVTADGTTIVVSDIDTLAQTLGLSQQQ